MSVTLINTSKFMTRLIYTTLFLIWAATILAQKSTYFITKTSLHPDSIFTERLWPDVAIAENFQTAFPSFGQTPQEATQVQLTYDDHAIYVNAFCSGSGIRADGTQRDNAGQADYFTVAFDTWNDGQNAFEFGVTAAGQVFERRYNDNQPNSNFLSPWSVEVKKHSDGWQAVFTIPFTALRYPNSGPMNWGLQLARFDRSSGERSTWSPESPLIEEKVWQFGSLEGMEHIHAREKLRATIYGTVEASNYSNGIDGLPAENGSFASLGTDLRWGIGTASTIQTTLLPEVSAELGELNDIYSLNRYSPLVAVDFPLDEQRIFRSDEQGLFPDNGAELLNVRIYPYQLGVSAGNTIGGRPLNTTRFSTQTNSNWRLGAGLTLLTPLIETVSIDGGDNKGLIGAAIPTASLFTAQKIWRNNSAIRFSTANFLPGGNGGQSRNTLDFRVRDRTNQYEISGFVRARSNLEPPAGIPGTNLEHRWSAGKVNGAWQYGISSFFWGAKPRVVLDSNLSISRIGNATAHISNTILPKNGPLRWLNWGVYANVRYFYRPQSNVVETSTYYLFNTEAISRRFNEIGFSLGSDFTPTTRSINIGQIIWARPVGAYVYSQFRYSTDTRKRSVFASRTYTSWNWGNRFVTINQGLSWRYQWNTVLQTRALIEYNHVFNEEKQLKDTQSGLLFTIFDRSNTSFSMGATLFLNRRWNINADIVFSDYDRLLQPEEFQLTGNGPSIPTLATMPGAITIGTQFGMLRTTVQYVGPNGTQVRFIVTPARATNFAPSYDQNVVPVRLEFLCHLIRR